MMTKVSFASDGRASIAHRRNEISVDENHAVAGVLDHLADLLGEEPDVDGVQDRADAGHAVVELGVPVRVPAEARNAVTAANSQAPQRVRQARDPAAELRVGVAGEARPLARDDLARGVIADRVVEDSGDRQRDVHHETRQGRDGLLVAQDRSHG
jgi:hypothetical protein